MSQMYYTYADLYNAVGKHLGTYGDSGLTGADLTDAQDYVKSGYKRFLMAYPWSFLRKNSSISLLAGEYSYDMPEDFVNILLPFTFTGESGYPPMDERSENEIMELRNYNEISSWPQYYAFRYSQYSPEVGQRRQVIFWPTPDSDYSLYYTYRFEPAALSNSTDYPIGGSEMAECILQFCLAAAENRGDESLGVHSQVLTESLAFAIRLDRAKSPRNLGYSGTDSRMTSREVARGSYRVNDVNFNL
jgi:hypothetical protein